MMYVILSLVIVFLLAVIFIMKGKPKVRDGKLSITSLSVQHQTRYIKILQHLIPKGTKLKVNFQQPEHVVFVVDFKGGIQAQQVENLREEISAIISTSKTIKPAEVIIKLDSPGGTVTGYGLAAAQIARLRKLKIPVTVVVDQVAASGGYMMASVADKILAAPFSIIGSVGVVLEFPNFSKLLNKVGINYQQYTAGEFKRTVSPMMEPSEAGDAKTKERLEKTLSLFKNHIKEYRPQVEVEQIATGETWYALEAKEKNLVDEVMTYDEYLQDKLSSHEVFKVKYEKPEKISRKLSLGFAQAVNMVVDHWMEKINRKDLF